MQAGPVPWNQIVEYGERAGLEEGMLGPFIRIIRELDDAYLTWVQDASAGRARTARRDAKKKVKK